VIGLALAGCHEARSADPVILTLDDQVVRKSEFDRHLAAVAARGGAPLAPEVQKALLEPFLEERVLVLEARAEGLCAPGASPEQEQEAAQRVLQTKALAGLQVSPAEIEQYYAQNQARLGRPETVTVRQIVVPTSNEARDIQRRLQKDPKQFEALAQTRSRAPEASKGGLMGTFARGQLPVELENAVFGLAPGVPSEVVVSPLGHHVLRVDARQEARVPTLEESREEIKKLLLQEKTESRVQEFVRSLLARAKVNHEAVTQPKAS
jgi:parvulin-like peptidyl-prolyl isomerase